MIENNRNKNINVQCVHCKKEYALFLNENDYSEWKEGNGFIQDKLPYLTAGERELLISGTCDSCFDNMFGSIEEDDE